MLSEADCSDSVDEYGSVLILVLMECFQKSPICYAFSYLLVVFACPFAFYSPHYLRLRLDTPNFSQMPAFFDVKFWVSDGSILLSASLPENNDK